MTNNCKQISIKNNGKCDICEIVYASEMVSMQHMLSLKHHRRYETVQRSLGNSVSHFCPVCGIGGIQDINAWSDHVDSLLHSSNFDQYLQISNAQKTALKRHQSNRTDSSASLALSEPQSKAVRLSQVPPSGLEINVAVEKSEIPSSHLSSLNKQTPIPQRLNHSRSHYPPIDRHSHRRPPIYRKTLLSNYRRSHFYRDTYSPTVAYMSRPSHPRGTHSNYNHRSYKYYPQGGLSDHYRPYRCSRSVYRPARSKNRDVNVRSPASFHSVRFSASRASFQPPSQEHKLITTEAQLTEGFPVPPKPQSSGLIPQDPVQQMAPNQEQTETEHLQPIAINNSTQSTHPALPPWTTSEKTHEIWELSEALDELRRQQSTLTHYIRQLKYIRQHKTEEKRLLRRRRSAFLLDMNQSDSQAETGSSDEFDDETRDELDKTENVCNSKDAVIIGDGDAEVIEGLISNNGSTFQRSMSVHDVAPSISQLPAAIDVGTSDASELPLVTTTKSKTNRVEFSPTPAPSATPLVHADGPCGIAAQPSQKDSTTAFPTQQSLPQENVEFNDQISSVNTTEGNSNIHDGPGSAVLVEPVSSVNAAVGCRQSGGPRIGITSGGRVLGQKGTKRRPSTRGSLKSSTSVGNIASGSPNIQGAVPRRRSKAPLFSSTGNRKWATKNPSQVEASLYQPIVDEELKSADSEGESELGVDLERLSWVRRLLTHPNSREYTFADLDKLVDDVGSNSSSLSPKQT